MEKIQRKVSITVDVEHLKNSSVFGVITDEILLEHFQGWVDSLFIKTPIFEEHGDFYSVSNPQVSLSPENEISGEDELPQNNMESK